MFMLICLASQKKYIFQNQNSQLLLQFKRFSPAAVFFFFFFFSSFLDPRPRPEGSVRPSFRLSVSFFGIGSLVFFLKLSIVLGAHIQLSVAEPDFLEKFPNGQKSPKMVKNVPKTWFLNSLRTSRHQFCLEFV